MPRQLIVAELIQGNSHNGQFILNTTETGEFITATISQPYSFLKIFITILFAPNHMMAPQGP